MNILTLQLRKNVFKKVYKLFDMYRILVLQIGIKA